MNPELVEEVELNMNHKSCDWSEQCHRYVEHLRKEQYSTQKKLLLTSDILNDLFTPTPTKSIKVSKVLLTKNGLFDGKCEKGIK